MTDRINYLTVVLDADIRDDDAEPLIAAIKLLRGVLKVKANVVQPGDYLAATRAKYELTQKLWDVLK